MPRGVLPDAARVLPPAGQKVWLTAFNGALDEGQSEEEASKEAWAAVKRAGYEKKASGKWGKSMDINLELDDKGFVFSSPITKIDVQNRIVGGYATLDNIDNAGDLVDAEASQEAFGSWFGNIREMHNKQAVGKAIKWEPKVYKDDDGTEYNGIWVEAKISKGAEDTWQKVLDGTLGGFSIGGATLEKQRTIVKSGDVDKQVWRITKYRLTELSLVDAPCNGLARISLIKSVDGEVEVDDIVADEVMNTEEETDIEKAAHAPNEDGCCEAEIQATIDAMVKWRQKEIDEEDEYAVARISELLASVRSYMRAEMYEHKRAADSVDAMYYSLDGVNDDLAKADMAAADAKIAAKGGQTMEKSDETLTDKENSDTNSVQELTEEERSVFRKFVDFLKGNEVRTESNAGEELTTEGEGETPEMNTEDVTKAIDEATDALTKSVDEKFTGIGDSLTKIAEALEKVATAEAVETVKTEIKTELDALVERVTTLENSGAVKKSGEDAGKTGEKLEKSDEGFWGETILPEFLRK